MFCDQCGLANEEGSKFCEGCGAPLQTEDTSAVDSIAETPVEEGGFGDVPAAVSNPLAKIMPFIIGIGAIALVVILLFAFGVFKKGSLKVTEKYIKACIKADGKAIYEATIDPASLERITDKEMHDCKDEEDIIEFLTEEAEEQKDHLEEELGDNVKVTKIEKKKIKNYEKRDIKKVNKYLEETYDCDEDYISGLACVKVKVTYKGSDDDDSETMEFITIKVKGKWYVVTDLTYSGICSKSGLESVLDR